MNKSDRIENLIYWSKNIKGSKTTSDFIENLEFLRSSGLGTPRGMDEINEAIKLLRKDVDRKNPAIIKPMKLKPGQRSRGYVAPVRLTQEEMKKRSAAHIEKMRAYRASRGWKEKVPNEQGRYTFGKRRPKADSGSYSSFGAWASAVRRAGGVPDSELSEPQGAHNRNTGQIIGEWDGFSGSVYRNNPVRQRIAVSLSRSQVRRNPFNDRNLDA